MFSRAAKSVVKSVGSHRIYTGEKNFKIALIGGAREISQTLSQLLRNNVKPNVLALYDVAAVNKPFYNFYHEQPFKSIPSEMSTMRKKSCLEEGNRSNTVINSTRQTDNNNHQGNNGRNQTEKLVEALYRLPIAEEVPALNSPLVPIEELMSKPQPENLTVKISKSEIIAEAIQKLKFVQTETFQRSLPKPIFGIGELGINRWNYKVYSMNVFNSGFISTRDSFKPRNIFLRHKSFDRIHEQSRKYFLKRSFMTKCKLPALNRPVSAMSVCHSTVPPSYLPFLKFYGFIEKYFLLYHNTLSSLSCHYKSVSLLRSSALYSKFVKKPPFLKICEKDSQFLECLEYSKLLAPSSKYLACLEYLLKWKLLSPELCKQYFLSCSMSRLTCSHSFSQCSRNVSKNIQEISKKLPKLQRNKTYKTSSHRNVCYPIFLHRRGSLHWRGFHSSLFPLAKSDSSKPSACKQMDEICKPTEVKKECGKPCKEKSDVCHQEKVKCNKSQQNKKTEQNLKKEEKIVDSDCGKISDCLPIGKCELPRTLPPEKMKYAKITCAPPKFVKPKSCPHVEHLKKDESDIKPKPTTVKKKKICAPPPLPKPPNAPIMLCPCSPPPKLHPGSCPCYETKALKERPSTQPCLLKKKYPCPSGIYVCPPQNKPCKIKQLPEVNKCDKKKKNTSAS
ncbi:hypothetical protein ALC56_15148 [Trachymyrmex septentrionalis]|uniref:Uncharacterized protein n=1 Tax=Trachymyrmex septentrionalis TaxID=34720 RepID=A0A195ERC1_9HYME|nr:hypothetical protein ALC56_15148 [Trachymyrmex septentrionalis]